MLEKQFELFLLNDPQIRSEKAVASRMAKARKAEDIIGESLDTIVNADDAMYDALLKLRANEDPAHSPMQNALRKYYIFKNSREFPQLRYYHR